MHLRRFTPFLVALACAALGTGTAAAGLISAPLPSKAERAAQRLVLKNKRKLVQQKVAIRQQRKSTRKLLREPPVTLAEPWGADALEAVFERQLERQLRSQEKRITRTRASLERVRSRARQLEKERLANVPPAGGIVRIGRWIQSLGYEVSEHPAFGGVCDCHGGTDHYEGEALDVNDYTGSEMARLDALAAKLEPLERAGHVEDVLWRTEGHYDHLHVSVA